MRFSDVTIERIRSEYIDSVYEIERLSFKDPYPKYLFTMYAIISPETFLVAKVLDRVVGYVIGVVRGKLLGHIVSIAVHPEFRGRGIGKLLLSRCIEELRRVGVHVVRLEVRVSNYVAIKMYEKLGFRKAYIVRGYYSDGEDALVMYLLLP